MCGEGRDNSLNYTYPVCTLHLLRYKCTKNVTLSFCFFLLYTYADITPYNLYKENNFLYQNSPSHSGHFYLYGMTNTYLLLCSTLPNSQSIAHAKCVALTR